VIVDTSAMVAVLVGEPAAERLRIQLEEAPQLAIGAPTQVETGVVVERKLGIAGRALLTGLVDELSLEILRFDREHVRVAVAAYARFGKGRHPAGLNFGDCMTYATARLAGEPLLCLGDDFAKTDLEVA
jgi:ribonuclease VapC